MVNAVVSSWRRQRFANQELALQNLYKAQNLGFYQNIYDGEIIERCLTTVAMADHFSNQWGFRRALRVLSAGLSGWDESPFPELRKSRVVLALPSNLRALALIAEANVRGWTLLVEDCPFTRRFIRPLVRASGASIRFEPFARFPAAVRLLPADRPDIGWMGVTFPDRPFDAIRGSVAANLFGREYLFSIVEALLSRLAIDEFLQLGSTVHRRARIVGRDEGVTGRELGDFVSEQSRILQEAIAAAPDDYLGWTSLYSRSRLYFDLMRANVRGFFQSFLRQAQLGGFALPMAQYIGFLNRLERVKPGATAGSIGN